MLQVLARAQEDMRWFPLASASPRPQARTSGRCPCPAHCPRPPAPSAPCTEPRHLGSAVHMRAHACTYTCTQAQQCGHTMDGAVTWPHNGWCSNVATQWMVQQRGHIMDVNPSAPSTGPRHPGSEAQTHARMRSHILHVTCAQTLQHCHTSDVGCTSAVQRRHSLHGRKQALEGWVCNRMHLKPLPLPSGPHKRHSTLGHGGAAKVVQACLCMPTTAATAEAAAAALYYDACLGHVSAANFL